MTSGGDPVNSGSTVGLGTLLTVQAIPAAGNTLDFIAINGKHIAGAEAGNGYITTVRGETTLLAAMVDPAAKAADGGKGLILWDALNATITVTKTGDNSPAVLGELLAPGTELHVEVTPPTGDEYQLMFMELNGEGHPYMSFDVVIPEAVAGEVAPTFIAVRYEKNTEAEAPVITPGTFFAVTTGITGSGTLTLEDAASTVINSGEEVESGTALTVTATPATGYRLSELTLNGSPILSGGEILVTEASLVMAVFEQVEDPLSPPDPLAQREVRVTVIGNGTITLADNATNAVAPGDWVTAGTEIFIAAAADTGYELASLTVNDMDIAPDASFLATVDVEVKAVFNRLPDVTEPSYAVTTGVTGEGTLTLLIDGTTAIQSGEMIPAGASLTIHATAADGYVLNTITLNGLTVLDGYSFTLQKETLVMAVFDPDPLPTPQPATHKEVIVTVIGHGTVSLTDDLLVPVASGDQVADNTEITVVAEAAAGYTLSALTVNGTPITTGDSFTLTADTEVTATFDREADVTGVTYTVITGVTGEGTVTLKNGGTTVQSGQKVAAGTVLTVTATAGTGYAQSDITVNGVSMLPGTSFTVRKETTVLAIFDQDPMPVPQPATHKEVTLTVLGYGTVTLKDAADADIHSGDWVLDNTSIKVTATAATGYQLKTITVNGAPHTSGQSFTLTVDTEIIVNFERLPDAPVTPPDPGTDTTVYFTLEIPDTMPEGITINPAPGRYQVAEGSSKTLRLAIDERYDDKYVFLKINGDYIMVKAPQGLLDFSYTLVDIREALTIEVILSDTANPEEGTVGNVTLTPGVRVTGESGKLKVESDRATKVLVYTVGGKLVANGEVNGTEEFYLPAGIYIVRTTISTPVKVVVW